MCAAAEDLDEMNIEILRNTLYKAYLDDFAAFCNKLGGATAEVMGDLLAFEVLSCLAAAWLLTANLYLALTISLACLSVDYMIYMKSRRASSLIHF